MSYEDVNKYGICNGKVYPTNNYGEVVVLEARSSNEIVVKFLKTGYVKKCKAISLVRGNVLGLIYDRGWKGDAPSKDSSGNILRSYDCWRRILHRTHQSWWDLHPTYNNVEVCEEWYHYDTFLGWYENNCTDSSWDLDKDLLSIGGGIYSPDTCCFLPEKINKAIVMRGNGVHKRRGSYEVYHRGKYLGGGNDYTELLNLYADTKRGYVRGLAEEFDNLPEKVAISLRNFTLSVKDNDVVRLL